MCESYVICQIKRSGKKNHRINYLIGCFQYECQINPTLCVGEGLAVFLHVDVNLNLIGCGIRVQVDANSS